MASTPRCTFHGYYKCVLRRYVQAIEKK